MHNKTFINSSVFVRWIFIKWKQNNIATSTFLNNDNIYLMSWFKTFDSKQRTQKQRKSSFSKEIVDTLEKVDILKHVLNKIITIEE